jgi:hypothetical protein
VAAKVEDMRQKLACQTQKFFGNSSSSSSTTTANVSSGSTSCRGGDVDSKVSTKYPGASIQKQYACLSERLQLPCLRSSDTMYDYLLLKECVSDSLPAAAELMHVLLMSYCATQHHGGSSSSSQQQQRTSNTAATTTSRTSSEPIRHSTGASKRVAPQVQNR